MQDENNNLRIAIGSAFVLVGVTLVVAAVEIISRTQPVPWWAILLLVIGIVTLVAGLLILIISPRIWRRIGQTIMGSPTWLREIYVWHRYGPKCTIERPKIDFELVEEGQIRKYSTKVFLTVSISEKARNYLPVRCSFRSTGVQLEQKRGITTLCAPLELNPLLSKEILLDSPGNTTHWIGLAWFPYNNPATPFIDIQKPYTWAIKDVHVYLGSLQRYRNLSKKGRGVDV